MDEKIVNILMIEDNPDDAELIKRRLSKSASIKFEVSMAASLQEGVQQLKSGRPDLILSDLGLPDSQGLDTVIRILKNAPQIPLVVLSGFDDESTAIKAVTAGAQDYMVKGHMESSYVERALFYAIERARLQREVEQRAQEIISIQNNLLKILDKNADAIIVVGEDGHILFANPAVEGILGRNQKELINKTFDFPMDGGRTTEITFDRPGKESIIAEMRVVEITWEGNPAYLASLRNITERKKAEEAVRESEEKFSKVFQSSPESIVIERLSDGTILDANDTFFHNTSYTREEIIGKKSAMLNIWAKEGDRPALLKKLQEKGSVRNEEHVLCNRAGTLETKLFSAELINIGNEPCILSVTTDITERKKAEEALRESEEKFSKAFHSIPDSIVIVRMSNGAVIDANDTFFQTTGYTREEVINKKSDTKGLWANPEDRTKMEKMLQEKGSVRNQEFVFRNKSGELRIKLFSADIINIGNEPCILSVTTDITERKKAEEALRESEEKFSKIFHSSPESIVIARVRDDVIIDANDIFFQATGYTREEMINKKSDTKGVWANPEDRTKIEKTLQEKGSVRNQEYVFRDKSGDLRIKLFSADIINIGNEPCVIAVTTDITERKQAEEAIRDSEKSSRMYLEGAPDGVFIFDSQFNFIYANAKAEEMTGYKREDVIGKNIFKTTLVPMEYLPKTNDSLALNKANKPAGPEEFELIIKNGNRLWVEISANPVRLKGELFIVGFVRDISERKKSEAALRESEEKFSKVFRSSPEAMIITRLNDSTIMDVNDAFLRTTGFTREEVINKKTTEIGIWTELENRTQFVKTLKTKSAVRNEEYHFRMKAGELRTMLLSAEIVTINNEPCILSITTDITERKRAEEALRESEEKFRELISTSLDGIVSTDHKSRVMVWNQGAEKIFGYTEEEMLGQPILKYPLVQSHEKLSNLLDQLNKSGTSAAPRIIEEIAIRKDGSAVPIEISVSTRETEKRNITTAIIRDITERKEAEEKLRKIDQMKSEFLSNVSHELRTPLQSISGFTKLIMNDKVPDPDTQKEFLQIIDREALHLENLINSLLDMSRLESNRFQINKRLVPADEFISDPIKSFHSLARDKNITLEEEIPQKLPEIDADSGRLRQVVINLLSNAIKFSDPGSSVKVKVTKKEGQLLFQVFDHGIGISEEAQKHIFERFYRAEGETVRGGTGLGLFISKQIIEAHGGRIWASSKLGEGSTFNFILPLIGKGGKGNVKKNTGHRR